MLNLSELARGGTICLSKAGLVKGTSSTISIVAPNGAGVDFCVGGKLYHKGDTTNIAVNACAIQPVLTSCLYVVCLSAAASPALTVVKGEAVLTANVGNVPLLWPEPTAGTCAIGGFRIDTLASNTFTAGTNEIGESAVTTATFYDLLAVPDAPLVA